jgi:NADPH2:quinone reductase
LDDLVIADIPSRPLGPGEVRVRVRAAGVNFPDALVVQGKYQNKPPLPFSPGSEFSGVVEELGAEVLGFDIGDRVFGLTSFGAFAEEVVVDAKKLHRMGAGIEFGEAAAFCMAYGAAAHALLDRGQLKPGEQLVVLGAAGGVGLAAIEIAKIVGARVLAVDLNDERLVAAKQKGADAAHAGAAETLREAIYAFSGNAGGDVILDTVGGELAETALKGLAWRGRFLVFGFASGAIPKLQANLLLLKAAQAIGVFWGEFQRRGIDRDRENFARLLQWREEGKLRPHISRTFTLEEGAEALKALERREIVGKAVIIVSGQAT